MSSSQNKPLSEEERIKLRENRILVAEKEISANLKAYAMRLGTSSSVGFAMDVALGVDRKPILIKVLRELADNLEKGTIDG